MKTVILLVMHGVPPKDFPPEELTEFFRLHLQAGKSAKLANVQERYDFLDYKMRNWPRNDLNDPFHAASQDLAAQLGKVSGLDVLVGYNEFCAPSIDEALQYAVNANADKIIVATPMMTRGGDHAEKDIPAKIEDFRKRHPKVAITYAWPFDTVQVAQFLSDHISRFA